MSYEKYGQMAFPTYTGARCYMMPFIQGRPESLPEAYAGYGDIVARCVLEGEDGQVGLITIDESFVAEGASQRGYGSGERTLHTEACLSPAGPTRGALSWGPIPTWGPSPSFVNLAPDVKVLIANNIDDTCMVWDEEVRDTTPDGDLSERAHLFPRERGRMMKSGEIMRIGIFTPHECIPQQQAGERQFFRIVGKGVVGREAYFTENPKVAQFA